MLTLRESIRLTHQARARLGENPARNVVDLACSFTPLHLATLLVGHVQERSPDQLAEVRSTSYGDLTTGLQKLETVTDRGLVVMIEWQDLDPRLGMREAVGAPAPDQGDVERTARARASRLISEITRIGETGSVVVSLPSVPPSPVYGQAAPQIGSWHLLLDGLLHSMIDGLARSRARLVRVRGDEDARDPVNDLRAGFPYDVTHAARLASAIAETLVPASPKKGLITDLDDTVWRGLVGEIGADAVSWDVASGTHEHALYQQVLATLAARGVLVAVASKNETAVVEQALARDDMILRPDHYFPVVATWEPKSRSIEQILAAWNIGASDVVFVDDSPLELAEVQAAFPDITALQFPARDPLAVSRLVGELVRLFPSEAGGDETKLRLESLRNRAAVESLSSSAADPEEFLRDLDGHITIDLSDPTRSARPLELVNKTNQFNLNGRRYTEHEWEAAARHDGAVTATVSYEDRFGRLGMIAVAAGTVADRTLALNTLVMSCRAFSRAIETHLLSALTETLDVDVIELAYEATERNTVLREFLDTVGATSDSQRSVIDRATMRAAHPTHIHKVTMEGAGS